MKPELGELIWMECMPGGLCIFLNHHKTEPTFMNKGDYYKIYHSTMGLQTMPDYYFISLDEAKEHGYNIGNLWGDDNVSI